MFSVDFTFLWTAVNLLVIFLFVRHFLFKRLGAYMEKRAAGIAGNLEQAETLKAEGARVLTENKRLLNETTDRQRALIDEARAAGEREYARIVEEAKLEAARVKTETRAQIENERLALRGELSGEIAEIALAAAAKVLEANMDNEANRAIVQRFLADSGEGAARNAAGVA